MAEQSPLPRSRPCRRPSLRAALSLPLATLVACAAVAAGTTTSSGATARFLPRLTMRAPGHWSPLDPSQPPAGEGPPSVLMSVSGTATTIWLRKLSGTRFSYEVATIAPDGALGKATDIFGSDTWQSLSPWPTLLPYGKGLIVVFDGQQGSTGPYSHSCVVGAASSASTWVLQPWSLSNDCADPVGGATETNKGTLSAAWPEGRGILYRIGVSSTIPAAGPDNDIAALGAGTPWIANETTDTAGHVYAAWWQDFSSPSSDDGYYVKDLTGGGPVTKAPGAGTNTVNTHVNTGAQVPIASTNSHPGVYLAYCSNGSVCSVLLWRVGFAKALVVPHSAGAWDVAIAAGPDGRIWVAWDNGQTNAVSTVRTNKADTAFGPVETYATPCSGFVDLGLGGGEYGRLDLVMQCENEALNWAMYVTQSLAGLSVSPARITISNKVGNKVLLRVTDAGDAVSGATVTVDGRSATTSSSGVAYLSFPKGVHRGHFAVTASAPNYYSAHGALDIGS